MAKRDHTPAWAIVLIGVAMFVLAVVTALYWLVVASLAVAAVAAAAGWVAGVDRTRGVASGQGAELRRVRPTGHAGSP